MGRLRVRFICDSHYKDWNSGDVSDVGFAVRESKRLFDAVFNEDEKNNKD